jgi:hypothetical protein
MPLAGPSGPFAGVGARGKGVGERGGSFKGGSWSACAVFASAAVVTNRSAGQHMSSDWCGCRGVVLDHPRR